LYSNRRPQIAYNYTTGSGSELIGATVHEINDMLQPDWLALSVYSSAEMLCDVDLAEVNGVPALVWIAAQPGGVEIRYASRKSPLGLDAWAASSTVIAPPGAQMPKLLPQLIQAGDKPGIAYHDVGGP